MSASEEERLRQRVMQLEARLREVRVGRRILMGLLEEALREKQQLAERLERAQARRKGEAACRNSVLHLVPGSRGDAPCQQGEKEI